MNPAPQSTRPASFPLLRVTLAHEYCGGEFPGFAATPLPDTAATGRRLGLQVLQSGATLTVFARCDRQRAAALTAYRAALAATTFCWEIAPQPADFAVFTDLDFAASRTCLVLTPHQPATAGGNLTTGRSASPKDLWPVQPLAFDFAPATPLPAGATVSLETGAGVVLRTWPVVQPTVMPVDVTGSGSGLYRLKHGDTVLARWFADARGPVRAPAAAGSMLVLPGTVLAAALPDASGAEVDADNLPLYRATYPARPVTWQYHVFASQPVEGLEVVSWDDAGIGGLPPTPTPVARRGGRKPPPAAVAPTFAPVADPLFPQARSFRASRPFKLVQTPPQRFALRDSTGVRCAPLPLAAPATSRAATGGYCSDLFVHL